MYKHKKKQIKDDKGFWEYSIFQKIIVPNEEQNIKNSLKPEYILDLKNIDKYINIQLSYEDQLINNTKKLSSKEKIIYNKYIEKTKLELNEDINNIKLLGTYANPITYEGKIHYIMFLLDGFINKNQTDNVANIYIKLNTIFIKLN